MIETSATTAAAAAGLAYTAFEHVRARSVEEAAQLQRIPVHALIKTLVVRRGDDDYVLVLVPGDSSLDWRKLRDVLDVRRATLPDAEEARMATGYERGTITPFGTTRQLPVVADRGVAIDEIVSIGGGAHGVAIHANGVELVATIGARIADVTKRVPKGVSSAG